MYIAQVSERSDETEAEFRQVLEDAVMVLGEEISIVVFLQNNFFKNKIYV